MLKKLFSLNLLLCCAALLLCMEAAAQNALLKRAVKDTGNMKPTLAEQRVRYAKDILTRDFDFQLAAVAEGKFSINFSDNIKEEFSIKVYDIIGNLLYEEKVKVRGNYSQQIDLSKLKTNFFIVEIKNAVFNKTKSIVAS